MVDVVIIAQHFLYHIDDCSPEWHEDEDVDVEEVDEEVGKAMDKKIGRASCRERV